MRRRERGLLAALFAFVDAARWLAPPSRRRDWRRQWRADIWHAWSRASRRRSVIGRARIVRRTAGALRHAFLLRLHVRRLEMITHDLRYGWRQMLRRPALTTVAVLTLGLGIGANVTMFSWVDMTLRRQVDGVAEPDRWVALNGTTRSRSDLSVSYPDFIDYRTRRPASISDLIVFNLAPMNMRTSGDAPVRVYAEMVSGNYFDALGVRPLLGRGFLPQEDEAIDRDAVTVVGHRFWQRRLGGDPGIVGRTLTLNGRAFTVIGVAPERFHGTLAYLNVDLWVPIKMQPTAMSGADRLSTRGNNWLQAMVKLAPGVSVARAQADLALVAADLSREYPERAGTGITLSPLWLAPGAGGAAVAGIMGLQLAVAAVVLLIACANVANLLLASAVSRQRETAVRLTLGASRARVVQQLLTESTLLAAAGGIAGTLCAYWAKDLVRWFIPPAPLPIDMNPVLNASVMLFAAAVTTATAVVFGLVPALQGSRAAVASALKESAASVTAAPRRARLRSALVVAQVALSLLLLVSAGLFLRALQNAQTADPGFSTRDGLIASVDLLPAGYDAARGTAFQQTLLARARELPGVDAASLAQRVPLGFGGSSDMNVQVDGYTPAPNEEMTVYYNRVSGDYLRTLGIPLVAGREFTERDSTGTPDVVIVNETLARRYWPGRSAIGGRIRAGSRTLEVVGVARDGKYSSLNEAPRAFMYLALAQWYRPDTVLQVKTHGDPERLVPLLHGAIRSLDANVPLFEVRTIEDHLRIASFAQRMVASLLGAFGALALVLATVGLYGVVAAMVAQRTAEIGMRMALGARPADIVGLMLKQGLGMIGAGVSIGIVVALGVTRFFRSLLIGVSATDGATFAATTLLLVIVAIAATYVPARRAAAVDPMTALRRE
jgi:macrolide transport system ATP-binding/permease protein